MLCSFASFSWLALVILYIKYLLLGGWYHKKGTVSFHKYILFPTVFTTCACHLYSMYGMPK